MFNKNNLLIHSIANKNDNGKIILQGVKFEKDKTVATDGYKLIEVKNPDEMLDDKEFPQINEDNKTIKFNENGCIIPTKSIKKVLSNLTNKNPNLPILNNCIFLNSNKENSKIATTDLEQIDIVKVRNIIGDYPDCNEIIPKNIDNKEYIKIIVNIKFLKEIIETISKMNLSSQNINLYLSSENKEKPIIIKTNTKEKQNITALLMPVKEH